MPRLLVIGDVMVDVDVYLEQTRVAPEGCPVWVEKRREQRPGGAAAVAVMAAALGAEVHLAGIAGGAGHGVCGQLRRLGVNTDCVVDAGGITTTKQRLYVTPLVNGSQRGVPTLAARIDEDAFMFGAHPVLQAFEPHVPPGVDVVLVADHGKGMICRALWEWIVAKFEGRLIIVDPAKGKYPGDYPGANAVVANRAEAGHPGNVPLAQWRARQWMTASPHLGAVVIKLDRDGYVIATHAASAHEPSRAEAVVDAVGAGDQFLAALGVAIAEGESWAAAARRGNLAAGIKCGWRGTRPVTPADLAAVDVEQQLGVNGSAAIEAVFVG